MRRAVGFTLVELVIVIVILGIISVISVRFIQFSAQGAIDTANRQHLAMAGGIISEQFSREARSALPGTLRLHDDGECVEFVPIQAASGYETFELDEPTSSFRFVPFTEQVPSSGYVVIFPYDEASVDAFYDTGSTRTPLNSVDNDPDLDDGYGTIFFDEHSFPTHSPRRRFAVVDSAVTYCREDAFLKRYSNYPLGASYSFGDSAVVGAPLADTHPDGTAPFALEDTTLVRNAIVTLDLALSSDRSDEVFMFTQEVQVRNVP